MLLYRPSDGLTYLGISDGLGGFTFSPLSVSNGYDFVQTGDINGDGKADVFLYNSANGNAAVGISNGRP